CEHFVAQPWQQGGIGDDIADAYPGRNCLGQTGDQNGVVRVSNTKGDGLVLAEQSVDVVFYDWHIGSGGDPTKPFAASGTIGNSGWVMRNGRADDGLGIVLFQQ